MMIVEHVMDAIRSLSDRSWSLVMNAGRIIAEGPPAAVLANREVIRAYLESPMLEVRDISALYGEHRRR